MSLEQTFLDAPEARPQPITGRETPAELLAMAFPAYVGRQLRTAWQLMRRCSRGEHAVFLTMSGAMTPAGLHRSCVIPLIQRGLVDVLTTTGANLYHDAHRVIGHAIREIDPNAGDTALREARIIRIYDLGFTEDVLLETDKLFERLLLRPEFQRPLTTARMHWLLGRALAELEAELGVTEPCLLSACYRADVPVFVGAPQDGSIFLNVVKLKALLGEDFGFALDATQDVFEMAALQWKAQTSGDTAVWILGGGVPKNYTLQGEPTLSQIFGLDARGFDVDVQFCVDPVDNGALSSCPAGEGHTWGKVSAECVETSSVYVHADVTATVPWLVHALLNEGLERPLKRLYRELDDAVQALRDEVMPQRAALLAPAPRPPAPDLAWVHEPTPRWDADKQALFGRIPEGSLSLAAPGPGALLPGDWFRVEAGGRALGYAWMETTWGDAEIMLAVAPEAQRRGVGRFMLDQLAAEARRRGLNYLFNVVPPDHPRRAEVTAWLGSMGFAATDQGQLRRRLGD